MFLTLPLLLNGQQNYQDIEILTKEQIPDTNEKLGVRTRSSIGYQLIIEACFASKVNKYSMDFRTLSIYNDILLNHNFAFGAGIALRHNINPSYHVTYPNYEHIMISVFCDLRTYFLISRKISGYFAFDIGYYFSSKYMSSNLCGLNYNGRGWLLNPSSGLVLMISSKLALNIGIGYDMYKVGYDFSYYNGHPFVQICGEKITGSVGIKAGIIF